MNWGIISIWLVLTVVFLAVEAATVTLVSLWFAAGTLAALVICLLLRPLLIRLFPETGRDPDLGADLSANICANFLGLGNAATPMGISAARRMAEGNTATDSLCRLVVLNSASIQLIPANVAALRTSLNCAAPFDILPAVWVTSLCSATLGLTAAWILGRVWCHD